MASPLHLALRSPSSSPAPPLAEHTSFLFFIWINFSSWYFPTICRLYLFIVCLPQWYASSMTTGTSSHDCCLLWQVQSLHVRS